MVTFTKPPKSNAEHIAELQKRGLHIEDLDELEHYLQFIGYYRLSGYFRYFQTGLEHKFKEGTCFRQVLDCYLLDKHLRLITLDAIERIETAIKAAVVDVMCLEKNCSHWYLQQGNLRESPGFQYQRFIEDCYSKFNDSEESFVEHYKNTYFSPALPPSWAMLQLLTMGTVSLIYCHLASQSAREKIAIQFNATAKELRNWTEVITVLRNRCAHHSRVWNMKFGKMPKLNQAMSALLPQNSREHDAFKRTYFAQALVVWHLTKIISPKSQWPLKLSSLFQKYSSVPIEQAGFFPGWEGSSFWKTINPIPSLPQLPPAQTLSSNS